MILIVLLIVSFAAY
ncbi:hypothetical protein MZH01_20995 [Escherichia coli]|nr:hypothetical protein [Escherichia coli]MCK3213714.1 hypothetical protein [Escherichia coli]MCV1656381.1 hypothetical protein [Escherichia coli]MDZ8452433.1 hypothetical protein [Escherichia coli]MDZ8876023.1 hypothetical protein [Escherichia coli]MDZ9184442.1 hypothetical protein [Escherichia coli]